MTIGRRRHMVRGFIVLGVAISVGLAASSGATGRSAAAPSLVAEPSISGTPIVGHTLKGDRGKWNGTSPLSYAVAWVRCDENGASCTAISGATTNQYSLISADLGATIRFRVTASNGEG